MSYKPTPITARILRTTKGGITQPILNMGAAVGKMKAPSALTKKLKPGEGVLKSSPKSSAGNFEPAGEQKDFIPYAFRQDSKIGGGSHSGVKGKMGSDNRKAEYDKKGWAYDETISKASVKKANPRPKVKAANTIKAKGVNAPEIENVFVADHSYKPDPAKGGKKNKAEPSKGTVRKANRKLDSADRKDSRAARVRQKGIDALASGNTKKALRLKRRETRIKNRAAKKRGQAASAIQPK